jgi:hypothetical protein
MVESKVDEIYRMHHALYHDILRRQGEWNEYVDFTISLAN